MNSQCVCDAYGMCPEGCAHCDVCSGGAKCLACGCDPYDADTLGSHEGAACSNPDCPTDCYEPVPS